MFRLNYCFSTNNGCHDNNAVAKHIDNQYSCYDNDSVSKHKTTNYNHYSSYYYER